MKIWVKFNAGFQLCPPDFNFAPRSREADDAPVLSSSLFFFGSFDIFRNAGRIAPTSPPSQLRRLISCWLSNVKIRKRSLLRWGVNGKWIAWDKFKQTKSLAKF